MPWQQNGEAVEAKEASFTYDEILNTTFSLVLPADYYAKNADTGEWEDMRFEDNYMEELVRGGVQLKIVGIVRPDEEATATSITGAVGYTIQILAQRNVNPTLASILMCMESVFSVLGGALLLGETLTRRESLGCAIMFAAVILAQLSPALALKKRVPAS